MNLKIEENSTALRLPASGGREDFEVFGAINFEKSQNLKISKSQKIKVEVKSLF